MVRLEEMPEEIIIMVLKKLDFCSQQNMYNTCSRFRNIVCMQGVIKECNISMSVMATVKTLNSMFFQDLSYHFQVLNMSGLPDLYKTKVMPAFKKMKFLHTLDISFTNLNVIDLIDLYGVCPTLKNVTVNFVFEQSVSQNTLLKCQSVFEQFENVNFIGSHSNLLVSKLPCFILQKSKLHSLKFTVVEPNNVHNRVKEPPTTNECQMPHFNSFTMYLLNWRMDRTCEWFSMSIPVLSVINFKNPEFFIISSLGLENLAVFATPIFKSFFHDNFNVPVSCVTEYTGGTIGNVVLMLWNKETTNFDENFFYKLKKKIKLYYPYILKSPNKIPAPREFDWFLIKPKLIPTENVEPKIQIKKKRYALQNVVLDFDDLFIEKQRVELSIMFTGNEIAGITLSPSLDYLWKLTYFSISGTVSYSYDFFSILFRCCINLETLNVEAPVISPCALNICRSIQWTKSLRNIRLVDKRIDLNTIFSSFSQCKSLENIHIIDLRQLEQCQIADPSVLIDRCNNLYCVVIEAQLAITAQTKMLQMFNKAKLRCERHCLKVIINQKCSNSTFRYNFDPFVKPFQLYSLKPV